MTSRGTCVETAAAAATDSSTDCLSEPDRERILLRWMVVGNKVEAETKKAFGLGENDDLEAYCKRYLDAMPSTGGF